MSIIRKMKNILVMILKEKFLDVKIGFYLSERKGFLHMGLDKSLTSLECYKELTEEICKLFSVGLEEKFKLICPPFLYQQSCGSLITSSLKKNELYKQVCPRICSK